MEIQEAFGMPDDVHDFCGANLGHHALPQQTTKCLKVCQNTELSQLNDLSNIAQKKWLTGLKRWKPFWMLSRQTGDASMSTVKKELLRDDRNGKIAGVCAGLADYFGWELWLVRVVALAAVLLGFGSFLPVLYLLAG